VYVADAADGTVQKFTPEGQLVSGWGEDGSIDLSHGGPIKGITVSTTGDLFVSTYRYVFPTANYLWTQIGQDGVSRTQIDAAAVGLGSPGEGGIEINSTGGFYASQEPGGSGGVMYKHPNGRQSSLVYVYPLVFNSSHTNTGIALDRLTNDLYVSQTDHIDQIRPHENCIEAPTPVGPPQNICDPDDSFGQGHLKGAAGLAFAPATRAVYAADAAEDRIAVFKPLPMPSATTGDASASGTTAHIAGHVDPATAGTVTGCRFEYGTDLTYGDGTVPCSPGGPLTAPTDVSADLSGLAPLTTYHYRLTAEGSNGWPSYGADRTFTSPDTLPAVAAGTATGVGPTAATLNAQVNPMGSSTVYRFDYGTSTDYQSATPISEPIGADETGHAVSTQVADLVPGTTYHFRVVAINFSGQTAGPDRTFSTPAAPSMADSAISEVTATGATFTAVVRPSFSPTALRLEYGAGPSLDRTLSGELGADGDTHSVRFRIDGLSPRTGYRVRIVATNAVGSVSGPEIAFTTAGLPTETRPSCKRGFVMRHGKCRKKRHKKGPHRHRHGHGKKRSRR
jgi:hypothetical protein